MNIMMKMKKAYKCFTESYFIILKSDEIKLPTIKYGRRNLWHSVYIFIWIFLHSRYYFKVNFK